MSKQLYEEYLLAQEIRDYVKDRAAVEGVAFDLPLDVFFEGVLNNAKIFGVHHDRNWMLGDDQEPFPGYFEGWMQKRCGFSDPAAEVSEPN